MAVNLNPYLSFRDNAREAMEFYHSVLGGNLTQSTFKEFNASEDDDESDLIMHAMLVTDGGLVLMASDTPKRMVYNPGTNISVSLSGDMEDDEKLSRYFDKLSGDGGKATMPLEKALWGDKFGMCVDKFGIHWMVNIAGEKPAAQ